MFSYQLKKQVNYESMDYSININAPVNKNNLSIKALKIPHIMKHITKEIF